MTESIGEPRTTGTDGAELDASHLWNQEPLDHTRYQGDGRFKYGCPVSRAVDLEASQVRSMYPMRSSVHPASSPPPSS